LLEEKRLVFSKVFLLGEERGAYKKDQTSPEKKLFGLHISFFECAKMGFLS